MTERTQLQPIVLCVSGTVASGKSTATQAIANATAWKWASFGDEVRRIARDRGLDPTDRLVLREIGQSLVENDSDGFCRAVLKQGGWQPGTGIVLDGVRHVSILRTLQRIAQPVPVRLAVIQATDELRDSRLQARREKGGANLSRADIDGHKTEREVVVDLPAIADITVSADLDVLVLAQTVIEALLEL